MKTIILFGGTGGIGKSLYECIKNSGKSIIDNCDFAITPFGSKDVDLSNEYEVKSFFKFNNVDIIINMSGFNNDCFIHGYDNADLIEKQIKVNIMGNINILRYSLPHMRKNGYGRIILPSSILSEKTVKGTSIYSACKSFIESLVRVAAVENAKYGITINALKMGYMDAGLTYKIKEEYRNQILKSIPANRFGSISDIYNAIHFIINCDYINGQSLSLDGGLNGL